jgi:hypothetical protein
MSLIDTAKWDQAKWAGVFFQYTDDVETYPPILGLMFRKSAPAKDIFAALKARLGQVDERRALRVTIIRGISAANPSHYAVVIKAYSVVPGYNRRFYRHVSFETVLGLAVRRSPISYWDITGQQNPRKNATPTRRNPRRRKTASGMRQDGVEPAEAGETWLPGTTE